MQHSEIPGVRGAFVGVDVFFVLSGFLITTLLYEEAQATGQISVARFLRNRAIRLMPPLLMFLAAAIAIGPYFWPNDNFPLISLITALYLTDYVNTFLGELSIAMHTWSLAVEQHYYLIWPMIVLYLCKVSADQRIRFLIVAFILLTLWRISNAWFLSDWALTAYRFDTRASGLVIGSALALTTVAITKKAANILGLFSLVALCCLALTLDGRPFLVACAQPVIDLAAAGLIVSIIGRESTAFGRLLSWQPIVYCGVISYSLYLWHYPISRALLQYTTDWRVILGVTFVLSFGLAALTYEFVERPLKQWRHLKRATTVP